MALNHSNSSNLEQLALKGLIARHGAYGAFVVGGGKKTVQSESKFCAKKFENSRIYFLQLIHTKIQTDV